MEQYFFLSLFAVSATLLGICVAILNFNHSTLLNREIQDGGIILGDVDYKSILEKTIKTITIAGVLFGINTIGTFCLFLYSNNFNYNWNNPESNLPTWFTIGTSIVFIVGCLFIIYTLLLGKIKLDMNFPEHKKKLPEEVELPQQKEE